MEQPDGQDHHPGHGGQHQQEDPPLEGAARSQGQPHDEEGAAHQQAHRERCFDDPLDPDPSLRHAPTAHRALSAIWAPTISSTAAMMTLSERACTRWVRRAPSRLPGSAPSAIAAESGKATSPRPK